MDALRFLGGVRPAAPPQPPVAPPPVQRQPRAALPRLWPRGERQGGGEEAGARPDAAEDRKQGNWVLQMLRVQPRWVDAADAEAGGGGGRGRQEDEDPDVVGGERCASCGGGGEEEGCPVGTDQYDGEVFDRASFSRLLRKVSIDDAKEYSRMSYLCNIAYMIPKIQPKCLRRYSLEFVTTSVQEKDRANPDRKQEQGTEKGESPDRKSEFVKNAALESKEEKGNGPMINPFGAYQVMASAASYVHSRAMGVNPFGSRSNAKNDPTIMAIVNGENGEGLTLDEASFVATTNSVTSMVAAKEETRQAVADDLNSSRSCPSEWFICDDDKGSTRYFVVQGSESIASWQANLLFEPVKFEGLDVLVHRGIYEAAKGMYHQMLPYVRSHLRTYGKSASLRFTGHSLGGSLALLVNLMLLMRGEAPIASLLPVITFGAPCIMCGGDHLLSKLGLPKSHVQSITMHRDIVPRVFSCNYPDHVANILKLANGNFRSHPCLTNQKLLYAPMGEVLILQPDKRLSPHHHLLPQDSGIYHLGDSAGISLKQLQSALSAFLNSPHPLDILKDGGAYGPKGSVYRDHDVNSYLRSVRGVVRKEVRRLREVERERWQLLLWWPLAVHGMLTSGIGKGWFGEVADAVATGGQETARRLQQHASQLLMFLIPVKLLVLGALLAIRLRS
ncbi:phospholipase A1 PLIP2, chloroplastic-like [Lolium rigidum]|uniref:phospholipase A1 PLIP2, chloroplastic-like n=1 Tax=Lolium rigidum TaxID=89674 RepID=UPI001F5CA94B|nr:phospholipase A1 PLIP2, chloroplastic-like [Lolium rigidum]